jgi:lipopolysaccharide biosynthesis protein/SAM-dependent methyltransferase
MAHKEQIEFCKTVQLLHPNYFTNLMVLDIGSFDINGNNQYLFNQCMYIGVDLALGKNVDFASKGHDFMLPDESFDIVISTECFEHDQFYAETIKNIVRMIKPGGMFLFSCATTGRAEHGTRKSTPEDAPFIQDKEEWADYYKNLSEKDIRKILDIEHIFETFNFSVNKNSCDLYFWGIKKGIFIKRDDSSHNIASKIRQGEIATLVEKNLEISNVVDFAKQEKDEAKQAAIKANQEKDQAKQEAIEASQEKEQAKQAAIKANQEKDQAKQAAIKANQEKDQAKQEAIEASQEKEQAKQAAIKANQEKDQAKQAAIKANQEKDQAKQAAIKASQEKEQLEIQLTDVLMSNSWFITKPLRVIRRLTITYPCLKARAYTSDFVRFVWRRAPFSNHLKYKLKNIILKNLPTFLGWSKAHNDWLANEKKNQLSSNNLEDKCLLGGQATGALLTERNAVPLLDAQPLKNPIVKLIAFYLPQFHPVAENNEWWGEGFTEWTNVKPAHPQFEGHYQPRIPGELGYYDLRDRDVQKRQIELAKLYGVGGFCFYFYWFNGKRLLETPLLNYLNDASLDFPFCLCWANENWSRRWDGLDSEILIGQKHSEDDDIAFIKYVSQYLKDKRCIRINDRPLLLIYRPSLLPDAKATVHRWRQWCRDNGIGEIYLTYTQSFEKVDPREYDFDAAVEFPPNNSAPPVLNDVTDGKSNDFSGMIYDWSALAARSENYEKVDYSLFRGVTPMWDNTARRKSNASIFVNSSPELYQKWLTNALVDTLSHKENTDEQMVFINAWNEWAEGAYLEPDKKYGYAYLQSTRNALSDERFEGMDNTDLGTYQLLTSYDKNKAIAIVVHAYYIDVFKEILVYLNNITEVNYTLYVTSPAEHIEALTPLLDSLEVSYKLLPVENRGRDVLPFLKILPMILSAGHDSLVKVHTKKSPHRVDGEAWLKGLLSNLLTEKAIKNSLDVFQKYAGVGIISPDEHIVPMNYYFGSNEKWIKLLGNELDASIEDILAMKFVAGTMFFAKTAALRPLLDLPITDTDFENEERQVDGTLAHALERIIPVVADKRGYCLSGASDLNAVTLNYSYAEKHPL